MDFENVYPRHLPQLINARALLTIGKVTGSSPVPNLNPILLLVQLTLHCSSLFSYSVVLWGRLLADGDRQDEEKLG